MSRRGKIARLPFSVRDVLNTRLFEGEQARSILKWLNSHPMIRSVLDSEFDGKPIRAQNLSEWRKGGYREWLLQHEAMRSVTRLNRDFVGLNAISGDLTEKVALLLTSHYLRATQAKLDKDGQLDWKTLHEFCSDLVALRRGDHSKHRLVLERNRLVFEKHFLSDRWQRSIIQGLKALHVLAEKNPKVNEAYLALAQLVKEPYDDLFDKDDPILDEELKNDPMQLLRQLLRNPAGASGGSNGCQSEPYTANNEHVFDDNSGKSATRNPQSAGGSASAESEDSQPRSPRSPLQNVKNL